MWRISLKKCINCLLAVLLAVSPCLVLTACEGQKPLAVDAAPAPAVIDIFIREEPVTEPPTEPVTQAPTEPVTEPPTEAVAESDTEVSTTGTMHADDETQTTQPVVLTPEEIIAINPLMKGVMDQFGGLVEVFGFAYDPQQDIFYSTMYPIQRFGGFNSFYDFAANFVGMYYNTRKIHFNYEGRDWMVQLWKGQYGITVGGEIGIYYKDENQSLPHYETVHDDDLVAMGFTLYKSNEEYFHRGPEKHWWLTGFKLLDAAVMLQLKMVAYFDWENMAQADAFETGLKKEFFTDITYARDRTEFWLTWTI